MEPTVVGRTFDAVLFDMDGTLIDSTPAVIRSWATWGLEFGLTRSALEAGHGQPAAQLVRSLLPPHQVDDGLARIAELELLDVHDITMLPGAAELLAALPGHRVAVVTSATRPLATARLRKSKPGITYTIIEGLVDTVLPALRHGEIDLAVGTWPRPADSDISAETLIGDRLCVVAGPRHPLVRKDGVELSDLLEYPWVLPPETQRFRQLLAETFLAQGLPPPVPAMTSNSANFIRTVLLDNQSLSFLPLQSLPVRQRSSTLVALDAPGLSREVDVTISVRQRAVISPAAHALIAALRDIAHDIDPKE